MVKNRKIFFISILLVIFGFSLGFYLINQNKGQIKLPSYAQVNSKTKAAYEYALTNSALLKNIPCYCGCASLGYKNVDECFIKEIKQDGQVVFDKHGANCGACVSIVSESKKLFEEGKSLSEIQDYIKGKYSN